MLKSRVAWSWQKGGWALVRWAWTGGGLKGGRWGRCPECCKKKKAQERSVRRETLPAHGGVIPLDVRQRPLAVRPDLGEQRRVPRDGFEAAPAPARVWRPTPLVGARKTVDDAVLRNGRHALQR